MKVKIISMQRVYNHGSFLQAYGLKKIIEEFAEDVRFEDIIAGLKNDTVAERFVESSDVPFISKYLIKVINKIQNKIFKNQQLNILNVDYHFNDEQAVDLAVIGSDEMFNCLAPSPWGISKQLFGDVENSSKVITYAVSCGHTTYEKIPENAKQYLRDAMQHLNRISVRDNNTATFVKELTSREVQYNLDPVLMYDFVNELVEPKLKRGYILIYSYTNRICNSAEINAIKSFAKKNKLITIGAGVFQYWCDRNIPVSSFELLGYFKNAAYIVTDTFHGAVISIKYNKQFVAFVRKSNQYKLGDLLNRFNLGWRAIQVATDFERIMCAPIDYSKVNDLIAMEKTNARNYLKN